MERPPILIILSNWYSGATLLALLLDQLPGMICNGETFPFRPEDSTNYVCSCGEPVDRCEFFSYAARGMAKFDGSRDTNHFTQLPNFTNNSFIERLLKSPRFETSLRRRLENIVSTQIKPKAFVSHQVDFFQRALAYRGAEVYVDGTKSIRRAQLLVNHSNCRIYVVYLVRDPRGFVNSYRKNQGTRWDDVVYVSKRWNDYNRQAQAFFNTFPGINKLVLRYEDICLNLSESMNRIANLCGLKLSSVAPHHTQEHTSHLLGNRMRFKFGNDIRQDLSWKTELTQQQVAVVEQTCTQGMNQYHYD